MSSGERSVIDPARVPRAVRSYRRIAARVADQPGSTQAVACWGLTEGAAGMISQVKGLAAAVGLPFQVIAATLRQPWRSLWPGLIPVRRFVFQHPSLFNEPPPRLMITCGRQSVLASLYLKRRLGPRVFTVHIQNPRLRTDRFDLVVAPEHDGLTGVNVIRSTGAVHHVTQSALDAAAKSAPPCLTDLQGPFVTVLLGGPNRYFDFSVGALHRLADQLLRMTQRYDVRLAILPSRRTPQEVLDHFQRRFADRHLVWNREEANPYLAALALGTHIIATGDSVSMITEASATGKPVYVEHLPERRRAVRFRRFHESFEQAGITRAFDGQLTHWSYRPQNDTAEVARQIRERMESSRCHS